MGGKNKTLFLAIMGFVFLFLVGSLSFSSGLKESLREQRVPTSSAAEKVEAKNKDEDLVLAVDNNSQDKTPPSLPLARGGSAPGLSEVYYKVAKIVDGDTIDIIIDGKTERLRLIGLNTPEVVDPRKTVECFGREASTNAKKLLDGQEVKISADETQDDRDKYGRLLRYVWRRDGLFYNLAAIQDGFAYEYTYQLPYIYQKDFQAAQKYAQENELGLWADGACGQKNISAPKATAPNSNGACPIKGNIGTTGDRIYHLPNCSYYKQTVISESQGEKYFCTEAEAIAAGWRKAKNCP